MRDLDPDRRVGDRVEPTQRRGIVKHHLGDEGAVERTVIVRTALPNASTNAESVGLPGFGHVVGHVVGVDHGEAEVTKSIADSGLSRADARRR